MSATTISTFPALNSFNSPRSWFLVLIVLLHLGFFWALTAGLSVRIMKIVPQEFTARILEDMTERPAPPPPVPHDIPMRDYVPVPRAPDLGPIDAGETAIRIVTHEPAPRVSSPSAGRAVVIAEPQIDPRRGLSEPVYPSAAIRMGQTGTVILSVQVLGNGRIGEVRIEQSSGHPRLDDAAVREARRWRLIPGTQDGAPATMWKQIPITFRLQE